MPGADRWATVERLYHAAQALSVDRRAPFLAEACPDESIRREVESLLAQHGSANDALTRGAVAAAAGLVSDIGRSMVAGRRFGVYQVLAPLGAGGMGEVYRARDTRLGRDVAIKIVPHEFSSLPDRLARCEREARMLAALNHPHIAAIYGIEDDQGIHALVLELVDGETLAERIARGPLRVADALAIARQIADALDAAHEKGIVHRDLKPANVLLSKEANAATAEAGSLADSRSPKITDFGLAKRLDEQSTGTQTGEVVGTPSYMAPEQVFGLAADARTDLYALGCVAYWLLAGAKPFESDNAGELLRLHAQAMPPALAVKAKQPVPARLEAVVMRCLAKAPEERPQSADELGAELAAAMDGQAWNQEEAEAWWADHRSGPEVG